MKFERSKLRFVALSLSILLAIVLIHRIVRFQRNLEEFALGPETSSYFAQADSFPIHVDKITSDRAAGLLQGWENRGGRKVLFCLGNSQTHGINQQKDGDVTYNELLFHTFYEDSVDVLTHSLPNANLQEFYVSFSYWVDKLPIKYLTIPIFLDDLRETGIRKVFFPLLWSQQFKIQTQTEIAKKINLSFGRVESSEKEDDLAGLRRTVQEKSERYLNQALEDNLTIWRKRPQIRGQIFTNLYIFRNTALGITAQTKRKMIPERWTDNIAALNDILDLAQDRNIKVLIYVPPIRQDVEIPYIYQEYENLKSKLERISDSYTSVEFQNLESIVPGEFWGMKDATNFSGKPEYDFMHFQFQGHQKLANALTPILKEIISN